MRLQKPRHRPLRRPAFVAACSLIAACFPSPLDLGSDTTDATPQSDTATSTDATPQTDTTTPTDATATTDSTLPTLPDTTPDADTTPTVTPPEDLTASRDRASEVALTWSPVSGATHYRVERCAAPCDGDAWTVIAADVTATTYIDDTPEPPLAPAAPGDLVASHDRPDDVTLAWTAVVSPLADRYGYRVATVAGTVVSAPSEPAEGATAERPVTGYEVQINGGSWVAIGADATWSDTEASAPTLHPGTATASLATYAEHVRLGVTGALATDGASRTYRVRAMTTYGPAAASPEASGWREAGTLSFQWERSAAAVAEDFAPIAGATSAGYDDLDAPADGSTRWYRVVVSADGAVPAASEPVAGARQGPPGVPAAVQASADLVDRVEVGWQPVSGAIGYHVYRDGTKLTAGNGVTTTSYADVAAPAPTDPWGAPTGLAATTTDADKVVLTWTAPARPQGALVSYEVSAVSAGGEGPRSGSVGGRRVALALVGFDVEVTPAGGNATWIATGSTATTWSHVDAPRGVITPGTISVSQGTHRAHVRLAVTGASVAAATTVTYRVRGALADATTTPTSTGKSGRRATGSMLVQWLRADPGPAPAYIDLGSGTSFSDASAPSDGSSKLYGLRLSASGATTIEDVGHPGWRLAFTAVATGLHHTCARTSAGKIWCWGRNQIGQLGRGTMSPSESIGPVAFPTAGFDTSYMSALSVGANHACTAWARVWCWGDNSSGQLGDGTTTGRSTPVQADLTAGGTLTEYYDVSAGHEHTCARSEDGYVVQCWGKNGSGQLGDAGTTLRLVGVTVQDAQGPLHDVEQLSLGAQHSCARRYGGAVSCWGGNSLGQLGTRNTTPSTRATAVLGLSAAAQIASGSDHTCARLVDDTVACWGDDSFEQLGNDGAVGFVLAVSGLVDVIGIASTSRTSCAIDSDGATSCWGDDALGQVGNDAIDFEEDTYPQPEDAVGPTAASLGGGSAGSHFCAIVDYELYCWGANSYGQLGIGTTSTRVESMQRVLLP